MHSTSLRIRVVLVGDTTVGKTALAMAISMRHQKYLPDPFLPVTYESFVIEVTVEELKNSKLLNEVVQQRGIESVKEVMRKRKDSIERVEIAFMDAPGAEDYDRLRPLGYYQFADIVLLCAAADSPDSLDKVINKWSPEVLYHRPEAHLLLVGTKSDFRDEPRACHDRLVPLSDGETAAKKAGGFAGSVGYMECSSLTYEGIERLIATVGWVALHLPLEQTVLYQQRREGKTKSQVDSEKEGCIAL
ncbi:hypothetical protein FRC19_009629 [Serendipita sp. 401]|nr:hypothetical protein FRC19_009629 [Serendipita sp. 401]